MSSSGRLKAWRERPGFGVGFGFDLPCLLHQSIAFDACRHPLRFYAQQLRSIDEDVSGILIC